MDRRAQLSLFLILAVLLMFLVIGFAVLPKIAQQSGPSGCDGLVEHVETAVGNSLDYCLRKVGFQGGRFVHQNALGLPGRTIEKAYENTPVFVSWSDLTLELETCVSATATACLDDFAAFQKMGCDVEASEFVPHIVLAVEDVSLGVDYRLEANGKMFTSFRPEIRQVRMTTIHSFVDEMTTQRINQIDPADFNLDRMATFVGNISIMETPDGTQIYRLFDPSSRIRDQPFEFTSASSFTKAPDRNT